MAFSFFYSFVQVQPGIVFIQPNIMTFKLDKKVHAIAPHLTQKILFTQDNKSHFEYRGWVENTSSTNIYIYCWEVGSPDYSNSPIPRKIWRFLIDISIPTQNQFEWTSIVILKFTEVEVKHSTSEETADFRKLPPDHCRAMFESSNCRIVIQVEATYVKSEKSVTITN